VLQPSLPPLRVWVWTAATVALVVVAALLWRGSDAAATESTTAAPADVPTGTPAGAVSEAWTTDGGPLPESVVESGRVIVGGPHGLRALDPLTGDEAWHYTRSNARLCGLTATNGVAVAVFATENRCDEAVALNAGTGVRAWTRSILLRGDAQLDSTDRIVLATSPTGLVTLDPTGNNIRWRYAAPDGCRITDSDVGSSGVAVLQQCGDAVQLRLLDGFTGDGHWTRDLPAADVAEIRLLGADRLLGVLVGDEVQALSADDGALRQRLPADADAQQLSFGAVALFRTGDALSALDATSGALLWEAPAVGLPSAPVIDKEQDAATPGLLLVPDEDGFAHRDPPTGEELDRSAVDGLQPGGVAEGVGPVVVYRLADQVLGYR